MLQCWEDGSELWKDLKKALNNPMKVRNIHTLLALPEYTVRDEGIIGNLLRHFVTNVA